ncbi:pectate lyase family protein [Bradyrhizobium diazoefficiens]|uniref:hypothetical protein n=1 Tax=Bradyrhizobium diazoefficiens TaxID=1355477 RepID=UPI00347C87C0
MFSRFARQAALAVSLLAWVAPALAQAPSPVPALPDAERRTSYSITASTCNCAVGFALYGDSTDYANWLEVWVNGTLVPQSGNWTITSPSSADLSKLPRPITDAVLTFTQAQTGTVQIVGARRPRRTSQFAENRGVAARDLNQVITDIVAQNRETWDKLNDVTGRAVLAPPGETLAILASRSARANQGACWDSNGNLVSCVSVPGSTFTAGNGISLTGIGPTTITNNIQGSGPITITGTNPLLIGCPTCNTSPATATQAVFLASRAAAISLDLHTYTVVRTGGYASGGDGGGATFKNVGSASFLDSGIAGGNLTAPGSAYTNGTYYGVRLTGGTGTGVQANITVAGGVVTTVAVTGTGGNGYTVGDVLSATAASIGGTGSGFTWTVSSVSTARGSFTDSVGTHFQIVAEPMVNVRQFGAVMNYTQAGGDGAATNDQPAIQSALNFAGYTFGSPDAGGYSGSTVLVPQGAAKVCGGLMVPTGVILSGVSNIGTSLKQCDSDSSTTNFIVLGDPLNHQTSFFLGIWNMTLFGANSGSGGGATMVFTNSAQAPEGLKNVSVYPVYRTCVNSNTGYGGPSIFRITGSYFIPNSSVTPGCISLAHASNNVIDGGTWFSSGGPPWAGPAISIASNGASVNRLVDVHIENIATGVLVNVPAGGSGTMTTLNGVVGNATVTNLINRQTGSASGQLRVDFSAANGATCTVFNSGSCAATANVFGATY